MAERLKKIALFSHSAALAGAERCLLELVDQLISQFLCECLVILPSDGPLVGLLSKARAQTCISPLPWWAYVGDPCDVATSEGKRAEVVSAWPALLEAFSDLRTFDPDLIVSNTIVIPWGAIAAAILQKPHVWMLHEYVGIDGHIQLPGHGKLCITEVVDGSSRIITCSESVKEALLAEADLRYVHTVHPSIETPELERRNFPREGIIRIGIFTTIALSKGQLDAVLAAEQLLNEGYSVSLFLAGYHDFSYVNTLTTYIAEKNLEGSIQISGFINEPFNSMIDMDVLISCARFEAFGRFPVESMLLGKPVVYSNVGGPAEYHEDGVTGLAYTPGDPSELAEKLKFLIENPAEADALASQGQETAKKRFHGKNYARKVFPILEEAAGDRSKVLMPNQILTALSHRVVSVSDQLACLQNECSALLDARASLEELLELGKGETEALRSQTHTLRNRLDNKARQIQSLASTVQFKNQSISTLLSESVKRERDLQSQVARLDSEINARDMEVASLKAGAEELTMTLATEKASVTSLAAKLKLQAETISSHEVTIGALSQTVRELSSALAFAQSATTYIAKRSASYTVKQKVKSAIGAVRTAIKYRLSVYDVYAIKSSVYFDAEQYLLANPDVRSARMCPATHYLLHGALEGRNPSHLFDGERYLEAYPDVKKSGLNPLVHYELHGKKEGRSTFQTPPQMGLELQSACPSL